MSLRRATARRCHGRTPLQRPTTRTMAYHTTMTMNSSPFTTALDRRGTVSIPAASCVRAACVRCRRRRRAGGGGGGRPPRPPGCRGDICVWRAPPPPPPWERRTQPCVITYVAQVGAGPDPPVEHPEAERALLERAVARRRLGAVVRRVEHDAVRVRSPDVRVRVGHADGRHDRVRGARAARQQRRRRARDADEREVHANRLVEREPEAGLESRLHRPSSKAQQRHMCPTVGTSKKTYRPTDDHFSNTRSNDDQPTSCSSD